MFQYIERGRHAAWAAISQKEIQKRLDRAYDGALTHVKHELQQPSSQKPEIVTIEDKPFPKSFTMIKPVELETDNTPFSVRFGIEQTDDTHRITPSLLIELSHKVDPKTSDIYKEMYILDDRGIVGMATGTNENITSIPLEEFFYRELLIEEVVHGVLSSARGKE